MKRYSSYKDSGVEWIGEIPADWMLRKIKHDTYVKGRIGWQGLKTDEYLPKGFAYLVTGTDFSNGFINWESCFYVDQPRYSEDPYIQLKEGDLLITKDGTIGKIAVVKDMDKPSTLNSGIFLVRPMNGNYSTSFLYWILCSSVFSGFFDYHKSGSTISHLFQNVFVEFGFPVPPAHLQFQIVSYLDHKIHQIDDLIEKKQKLIQLLKEERNALINHTVTKGLDPKVPMKDSGIEWVGEIPDNWEVKRLKFISKTVQTGNTPPSEKIEYYENPDIEWFTPSDFGDNLFLRDSNRKIHSNAIKDGVAKLFNPFSVLIIGIGATLGKIGIIDTYASSNQQINSIEFSDFMNPTFAAFYLRTFESVIKNMSNAATLAILNQSNTKNIVFICPPKEDQDNIARYIEEKVSYVELMNSRITKEIELIKEYKTSLINEAVTGKIDVRDYKINHA